ncbi:hypothetical protein ADUPG1_012985, partial [Aduncisulcus paluster]
MSDHGEDHIDSPSQPAHLYVLRKVASQTLFDDDDFPLFGPPSDFQSVGGTQGSLSGTPAFLQLQLSSPEYTSKPPVDIDGDMASDNPMAQLHRLAMELQSVDKESQEKEYTKPTFDIHDHSKSHSRSGSQDSPLPMAQIRKESKRIDASPSPTKTPPQTPSVVFSTLPSHPPSTHVDPLSLCPSTLSQHLNLMEDNDGEGLRIVGLDENGEDASTSGNSSPGGNDARNTGGSYPMELFDRENATISAGERQTDSLSPEPHVEIRPQLISRPPSFDLLKDRSGSLMRISSSDETTTHPSGSPKSSPSHPTDPSDTKKHSIPIHPQAIRDAILGDSAQHTSRSSSIPDLLYDRSLGLSCRTPPSSGRFKDDSAQGHQKSSSSSFSSSSFSSSSSSIRRSSSTSTLVKNHHSRSDIRAPSSTLSTVDSIPSHEREDGNTMDDINPLSSFTPLSFMLNRMSKSHSSQSFSRNYDGILGEQESLGTKTLTKEEIREEIAAQKERQDEQKKWQFLLSGGTLSE